MNGWVNEMYKIIENEQSLAEWFDSKENIEKAVLQQRDIKNHLFRSVQTLDMYYGSNRDIKKDLGGYVVIFYGNEVMEQYKSYLDEYNLREEDFEFEDIYEENTSGGKRVVFRLYLCSCDYSLLTVTVLER